MIATAATSYRRKNWVVTPPGPAEQIEQYARELKLPPIVAQLLMNRGITDSTTAAAFLDPRFSDLHKPHLLPNIDTAAQRIATAVKKGEKITLYGDYDVDGITGTAMLWHILKTAGANVDTYIPHRVDEGYGLNTEAIDSLIDAGTQLLITVDCGCSAVAPITRARERNVDVVVSDHHEFAPTLPPAYAIVHPRFPITLNSEISNLKSQISNSEISNLKSEIPISEISNLKSEIPRPYPNPDLCGAGVAFKLAWAIAQKLCNAERVTETYRNLLLEFSALAALGTVADVVPLTGENRILVTHGLRLLAQTRFEGLRALIHAAGFGEGDGAKKLDCMAIGFSLAPRLNAAGRMGHAREAVELLTTATGTRADEIATMLETQNRQRQATERKMADLAKSQIEIQKTNIEIDMVLVATHESFHAGVVGIVASRLVDTYNRPAFVLARNTTECHGSARSIPGFELHLAIEHVRDLLTSGGGHAMAGGVRLPLANLDAFRQRLNDFARDKLTEDLLTPALQVDGILELSACNPRLVSLIEKLEPFGRGNPRPRFLIENVRLNSPPRRMGANGTHLQLTISRPPHAARCVAWRMGDLEPQLPVGTDLNLIVEPQINTWQGRQSVDLVIVDLAKCNEEPFEPTTQTKPAVFNGAG